MKFPYYRVPVSEPSKAFPEKNTLIPLIPIRIINNDEWYDCYGLIDSGADACLFPAEFGENAGITNIINDKKHTFGGVGGGRITAYFHDLSIEIGGYKFTTYIGFTYDNLPFPLLGQKGFFSLFKVIFELEKEAIELKPKNIK